MIEFNNPLQILIDIVRKDFPNLNIYIQFSDSLMLNNEDGPFGETSNDKENNFYIITLEARLPFINILEILAHELSHVIVGVEEDHNGKWEQMFSYLFSEYNKIIDKLNENKNNTL